MGEKLTGLPLGIGNHLLIPDIEHHPCRQHLAPVLHQRFIGPIIAAQLPEIITVGQITDEQQRKAGETRVDRVAAHVDDARIG